MVLRQFVFVLSPMFAMRGLVIFSGRKGGAKDMKDWFVPRVFRVPFVDDIMRWLNSGKLEAIAVYIDIVCDFPLF